MTDHASAGDTRSSLELPANARALLDGQPIDEAVIDALENCKVITLGSVGVEIISLKAVQRSALFSTCARTRSWPRL